MPSFGDVASARVVTIGLNPSRIEFVDRAGKLLVGSAARFVSLRELNQPTLGDASRADILRVYEGCCGYFGRNPYRRWFDVLEEQVRAMGASYYSGSAAHLDLAQWATDPVWGLLSAVDRAALIEDGRAFLAWQLKEPQIELALVNGRAVLNAFERWSGLRWEPATEFDGLNEKTAAVYRCALPGGLRVLGWSVNLQSSFGVTKKFRSDLSAALARARL